MMVRNKKEVLLRSLMGMLLLGSVLAQSNAPSMGPSISSKPSAPPSMPPSASPSTNPSSTPTGAPTSVPSSMPTSVPSSMPTSVPSSMPTTGLPSSMPTEVDSASPTTTSSSAPSTGPLSMAPSSGPTSEVTISLMPSSVPSSAPTNMTIFDSDSPSSTPTISTSTSSPSEFPSASAAPTIGDSTDAPSSMPSLAVSNSPSMEPSSEPSGSPSSSPSAALVERTIEVVQQEFFGISELPPFSQNNLAAASQSFQSGYMQGNGEELGVTDYQTAIRILRVEASSGSSRRKMLLRNGGESRMLQTPSVLVYYEQDINFRPTTESPPTAQFLAQEPFATVERRESFVDFISATGDPNLGLITSVGEIVLEATISPTAAPSEAVVEVPTEPPTKATGGDGDDDDDGLSLGAIIGIAVGGAIFVCLAAYLVSTCMGRDSDSQADPPKDLRVNTGDEISTLDGPAGGVRPTSNESLGYGDQSVATVDYDYSKAYGGGGEASVVSSAGGTFGSNAQGASQLDPAIANATGALGGAGSFEDDSFSPFAGNTKEELIDVFAPPGKLGVVIDTPDDGAPVVHAVKSSSVIADKIRVGDKLVAVDDEDVRSMTAIKVSKLISRKSANSSRKLSLIRTTKL